jgi:TDG/mug DNA glycosylase family protein
VRPSPFDKRQLGGQHSAISELKTRGEQDRGRQGTGQQGRRQEAKGRRQEGRREVAAHRPTPADLRSAVGKTIEDVIGPDLDVLFVGINPGLWSGATGHHFARPGNRFWRAIHLAGLTPVLLSPDDQHELLDHGLGVINLVNRTTARADELADDELRAGVPPLVAKVERFRPRRVCFLGVSTYRVAFGKPKASLGRQPEAIGTSEVWVLPNPSGLNAHYQLPDLARLYSSMNLRSASSKFIRSP